ncbi:MAG TPA: hypothetical protein VIQ05_08050 [Tardiphaga sp.]
MIAVRMDRRARKIDALMHRPFTAVMQVSAERSVRLPDKIASVGGAVLIQGHLPRGCMNVIDKLESYDRARLNLQSDFMYMTTEVVGTWRASASFP